MKTIGLDKGILGSSVAFVMDGGVWAGMKDGIWVSERTRIREYEVWTVFLGESVGVWDGSNTVPANHTL